METLAVRLLKPAKRQTIRYTGAVLRRAPGYVLLRARWTQARLELGYVAFDTGDVFHEHFYADHWFNIFELYSADGLFKGWYCNVSRPALIDAETIDSEDLDLDLFVTPAGASLRLDEDEFAARGFDRSEPATYTAALGALEELERRANGGALPRTAALAVFPAEPL